MGKRIAFIGLGVMGAPIAMHLASHGHKMTVYNRTFEKADAWVAQYGGAAFSSPRAASEGAQFVFSCVGDDEDLRSVAIGKDQAFSGMSPGAMFIDHTTTSAEVAREIANEAKARSLKFLDAPIAGGASGAQRGSLSVMIGGELDDYTTASALMAPYAVSVKHMGPVGSGQLTKMVNQICATGIIQSLAEGLRFAERAGLNVDTVIDVITHGSANSWQISNRARAMLDRNFSAGGAVGLLKKDLDICILEAQKAGLNLPVTDLVRSLYQEIIERGGSGLDAACLIELLGRDGHLN